MNDPNEVLPDVCPKCQTIYDMNQSECPVCRGKMNLREALEKKSGVIACGEHFLSAEIVGPIIEKALREALLEMALRAPDYWGRGQDEGVVDDCVSVFVAELVRKEG